MKNLPTFTQKMLPSAQSFKKITQFDSDDDDNTHLSHSRQ